MSSSDKQTMAHSILQMANTSVEMLEFVGLCSPKATVNGVVLGEILRSTIVVFLSGGFALGCGTEKHERERTLNEMANAWGNVIDDILKATQASSEVH